MENIVRFHVPSKISYTSLVEDFMRSLGVHIYPTDQDKRDNLCTVMNEVFTNVVKHSDTSKLDGMVRFQIEVGTKELKVSIFDHGPGIKINDQYPPYSAELIGQKFKFRRVLDGAVYLNVDSSHNLSFSFEGSKNEQEISENLKNLKGHGMGISIITKIMDSVTYSLKEDGQFDWQMTKKLD